MDCKVGIRVEHGVAPRTEDGLRVGAVKMLFHAVHGGPSGTPTRPLLAIAVRVVFEEGACKARPGFGVFGRRRDGDPTSLGIVFVRVVGRETLA
jgi:hypothetical protein